MIDMIKIAGDVVLILRGSEELDKIDPPYTTDDAVVYTPLYPLHSIEKRWEPGLSIPYRLIKKREVPVLMCRYYLSEFEHGSEYIVQPEGKDPVKCICKVNIHHFAGGPDLFSPEVIFINVTAPIPTVTED